LEVITIVLPFPLKLALQPGFSAPLTSVLSVNSVLKSPRPLP